MRAPRRLPDLPAEQVAWLAVLPCAIVVVAIMLLLGPPLGRVLHGDGTTLTFLSEVGRQPEPTEQARYLLALLAPVALGGAIITLGRRDGGGGSRASRAAVLGMQWLGIAFVAALFISQRATDFWLTPDDPNQDTVYFTVPTLIAAGLIAAAIATAMGSARARTLFGRWTRETRARRIGATLVALVALALWYSTAIHTDSTVGTLGEALRTHLPFTLDEVYAVLDGRSPMVDFVAQYGPLWAYVLAVPMAIFGASTLTYSITVAVVASLAMLTLFGVLRRLTRSSVSALLLFLPLLATSCFMMQGPLGNRYGLSNLPSMVPLRMAGPLVLLWLTTRHLTGAWPRSRWPIFFVGGLAVMFNFEFGVVGLGATVAALLLGGGRLSRREAARFALELVIALAAAFVTVAILIFARAGELPDYSLLTRFSRIFAVGGFGMFPLRPVFGFALVIYLTYVGTIAVAVVRTVRGRDRLLSALLLWAGCFGLGTGTYYMGRSHPEVLINAFPAWALCITLLLLVVVRAYARPGAARPSPAAFACLVAFGLVVCSLGQMPTPWQQAERLQTTSDWHAYEPPSGQSFVAARTRPGEPVVILMELGHRMAYNLGIDNVGPYAGSQSVFTREQVDETVAALREAGGDKLFASTIDTPQALYLAFERAGFEVGPVDRARGWVQLNAPWSTGRRR